MTLQDLYTPGFYSDQIEGSLQSAQCIVPFVLQHLPDLKSVVDFGCGTGAWLKLFSTNGVKRIKGLDGGALDPDQYLIAPSDRHSVDLSQPIALDENFDLAISLEVAEHIDEDKANVFIGNMCAASRTILFGAAIPGQGGHHHVNERWASYWHDKFQQRGYRAFDVIRPFFWNDDRVAWWYRQNMLIYVHKDLTGRLKTMEKFQKSTPPILDIIHPACFTPLQKTVAKVKRPENAIHGFLMSDAHQSLCNDWLDTIERYRVDNLTIIGAGGLEGMGPYLIAACQKRKVKIHAYYDFLPIDDSIVVNGVKFSPLTALKAHGAENTYLIASPGYGAQILDYLQNIGVNIFSNNIINTKATKK
ncbi:class I SAM-dependent methyltransferase [Eilatimonas milleporae]|uniref:Methyltransferase family protein n=1 Tax=Eilatimonas milleporae TaxID=911205 RepID=A0A3M0CDG9_9PROT|nr:methyltransferase domain-containing protein [Eilatimonas milleporae]RMB04786.1 methyltransferase family protein [Eilatimonas milleporae]